jgi:RimJ/RimL family protein N-acetyltransferase
MTQIKLRPWDISDLKNLVTYAHNRNISKNLTDNFPYPYTESNGRDFIARATQDDPLQIFAIDIDGTAVGGIGIHPQEDIYRKNAELGYWLAEPFWGQGISTEAIKLIIDFAFSSFDIDRIFARPFGTNIASQKVLEKNNFTLEGKYEKVLIKNGEYFDELIYAIRRQDWNK